jgi:hypothetical protein
MLEFFVPLDFALDWLTKELSLVTIKEVSETSTGGYGGGAVVPSSKEDIAALLMERLEIFIAEGLSSF